MRKTRVRVEKNFFLDEFIPKELYFDNPNWKLFRAIDPRMFKAHQILRDKFGSMTLNNYYDGGNRNESGLRLPEHGYFSIFSDHTYGRAGDSVFNESVNIRDVWKEIRDNYETIYKPLGVTSIEVGKDITWLHLGFGNMLSHKLFEIEIGEQW